MAKKKRKKTKSFNYNILGFAFLGILIVVVVFFGVKYLENNNILGDINIDVNIDDLLEGKSDLNLETCSLNIVESEICVGDSARGVVTDGANTPCYLFVDDGSGWRPVYAGVTSSDGIWSDSAVIDVAGWYDFRAVCDKNKNDALDSGDCLTNLDYLNVVDCSTPPPSYEDGTWVGGGDGVANVGDGVDVSIDLGDLPPTGEGNCKLQALISTSWTYGGDMIPPDECFGVQGQEGMYFSFYDSVGKVWERVDTSPIGIGSATKCGLVWDGVTDWVFHAEKYNGISGCDIDLEYDIDVVTCECGD